MILIPRWWPLMVLSPANSLINSAPLPRDTTHLFISSGGNDALASARLLAESVSTAWQAMGLFAEVVDRFQNQYRAMLNDAVSRVGNVAVCTVYDAVPGYDRESLTALKLFNEIILREAFAFGLPVIDLRLICSDEEDYSSISSIEPSFEGGDKISNAILNLLKGHDFSVSRSVVWA